MFSTRLVAASLALLLTTTGTGGTNQDTTQPRSIAFAGIGEINGDLVAIRGKIGPANSRISENSPFYFDGFGSCARRSAVVASSFFSMV